MKPETELLLAQARKMTAWGPARQQALWARLQAAPAPHRQPRASWAAWVAAASACVVVAAALLLLPRATPAPQTPPPAVRAEVSSGPLAGRTRFELPGVGELVADEVAVHTLAWEEAPGERRLLLADGEISLEVQPQSAARPLVVVTPKARVVVVGTRFHVLVVGDRTRVEVEQGCVRVEPAPHAGGRLVEAGERVWSDGVGLGSELPAVASRASKAEPAPAAARAADPLSPTPAPRPPAAKAGAHGCDALPSGAAKWSCYRRAARGEDLQAQNALFAMGWLARERGDAAAARERWDEYLRRFPHGPLAPEAALANLDLAIERRRYLEALGRAQAFPEAFPEDPRVPEVRLTAVQLLCQGLGTPHEIELAFDRLLKESGPALYGRVLEARRACGAARGPGPRP